MREGEKNFGQGILHPSTALWLVGREIGVRVRDKEALDGAQHGPYYRTSDNIKSVSGPDRQTFGYTRSPIGVS